MEQVTLGRRNQELATWRRPGWQGMPGHGHGNEGEQALLGNLERLSMA